MIIEDDISLNQGIVLALKRDDFTLHVHSRSAPILSRNGAAKLYKACGRREKPGSMPPC